MENDTVRDYYDRCGRMEWERIDSTAYNRIEHFITMYYLKKYLPKEGLVLDACGGPGRYTIELARMGYDVVLLDVSPVQLDIAREEISKEPAEVQDRVVDVIQGSIEDLSQFPSGHFDAVVCLRGALSHMVECDTREHAVEELARVTRPVGPIFTTVLSFYGALRKVLSEYPADICRLPDFLESRLNPVKTEYPNCFFFTPEEMVDVLARHGIEVQEYVGIQGLSAHLKDVTEDCAQDPARWRIWKEVLIRTCNHPSVVGVSDHILCVGFA
jgi:SAM-dependent methyltransferase